MTEKAQHSSLQSYQKEGKAFGEKDRKCKITLKEGQHYLLKCNLYRLELSVSANEWLAAWEDLFLVLYEDERAVCCKEVRNHRKGNEYLVEFRDIRLDRQYRLSWLNADWEVQAVIFDVPGEALRPWLSVDQGEVKLSYTDTLDVQLKRPEGQAPDSVECYAIFSDGSRLPLPLDKEGRIRRERVPAGDVYIHIPTKGNSL